MSAERLVLVTNPFPPELIGRIAAVSRDLGVRQINGDEIDDATWRSVEVLYTVGTMPAPERVPALRWVQFHLAGVEDMLDRPLFATPVRFTTLSGAHGVSIAEYVFAALLARTHRVPRILEWQARGEWPPDREKWGLFVPDELWGKTLGVVGYGSVGRQLARVARAFGMRVVATQRGEDRRDRGFVIPGAGDPAGELPERFYRVADLREMLAVSDVVALATPLTSETRGLIGAPELRAMKRDAVLVNVGRGAVCDEAALVAALGDGTIGGAILDAFEQEPLPRGHPLWTLPNVFLSPHISGFSSRYDERAVGIFCENLRRYLAGEALLNEVDKTRGY